jgi:uncharacterized protein YkwD
MAFGCAGPRGTTKEVQLRIQPNENRVELDELVQSVYSKVNEYRVRQNLPKLILHEKLNLIARRHSASMAQGVTKWSHHGYHDRFREIGKYVAGVNKSEILAEIWGHADPAQKAIEAWIKSPSHRKAMEDARYRVTGIGVAKSPHGKYYFTQLFVQPVR